MPDLPYLDENSDLHVTAAMAHEIHEAVISAQSSLFSGLTVGPAAALVERMERIVGREHWADIERRVQSNPAVSPTLLGMRVVIDEPE